MTRITYGLSALIVGLLLAWTLVPPSVTAQITNTINAVQSGTWNISDISGTVSLPTNAATAPNQTTLIGHVDGLEGLIGTTNSLLTAGTAPSTPTAYTALSTTVQTLSSSAGILDSFACYNPNVTDAWIQIFNISGTVTLGTSTATERYHIPAEQSFGAIAMSKGYDTAIKLAATTTATGDTAPSTGLVCNFGHR